MEEDTKTVFACSDMERWYFFTDKYQCEDFCIDHCIKYVNIYHLTFEQTLEVLVDGSLIELCDSIGTYSVW
jgi:hypothetical protein